MRHTYFAFVYFGILTLFFFSSCNEKEKEYDATGTFEATETTVFAEQSGALLTFSVNEGENIEANMEVGLIDTTQTWLKIQQLHATKEVYRSHWWPMAPHPRRCSTMRAVR